jgi:hypothetical protein
MIIDMEFDPLNNNYLVAWPNFFYSMALQKIT